MMPGLSERLTTGGLPVLRLHYSASEDKRPGTPDGDRWLADASEGYPGGVNSPRWRKEMEIDYTALSGTKLFPLWAQWQLNGHIVVPPFDPIGYKLYGSYDHGWRHPACYLVHGINADGLIVTLWEFWASHVPYLAIAKLIKGESVRVPGCGSSCHPEIREFQGNPYAGRELFKVADPSIYAEDKPQDDGTMKSTARLFRQEGVLFTAGEAGGDTTLAEWLLGHYWKDVLSPLYRMTTACPKLIWELGRQRHKDFSDAVGQTRAQPEELIDKDNDAFDALKYFLMRFPPTPRLKKAAEKPCSFSWWQQVAKKSQTGEALPSYQRQVVG